MARIQIKNLEFQSKNGDIYGFEAVSKSELDEFGPEAHEARVNTFIDKAKKEVVTLGQLDEFDPEAHKSELQTIADEVKNKMSIFNELTEIDIDELKAQIKAGILAELRTVASADGAGA